MLRTDCWRNLRLTVDGHLRGRCVACVLEGCVLAVRGADVPGDGPAAAILRCRV